MTGRIGLTLRSPLFVMVLVERTSDDLHPFTFYKAARDSPRSNGRASAWKRMSPVKVQLRAGTSGRAATHASQGRPSDATRLATFFPSTIPAALASSSCSRHHCKRPQMSHATRSQGAPQASPSRAPQATFLVRGERTSQKRTRPQMCATWELE